MWIDNNAPAENIMYISVCVHVWEFLQLRCQYQISTIWDRTCNFSPCGDIFSVPTWITSIKKKKKSVNEIGKKLKMLKVFHFDSFYDFSHGNEWETIPTKRKINVCVFVCIGALHVYHPGPTCVLLVPRAEKISSVSHNPHFLTAHRSLIALNKHTAHVPCQHGQRALEHYLTGL